MASRGLPFASTNSFGLLLRQLRKRAGMTQRDLAAALGYSDSLISSLETGQRQSDLDVVRARFILALGLQDDADTAARLIESATAARGEQLPAPSLMTISLAPNGSARRPANPQRLPALPIELIGRTALVDQLSNRLLGHAGRLLTLVGPPGVGKTTLALAVAARVQQHYADGAIFEPLATVNDVMLMATTLVATIAPDAVSSKPPERRLIELLSQQHLLLLLDNLEQIEGASSLIATLLAKCPSLTILATGRERLHLRAEQRCKVPPLALPAAVKLFVQRSQAVNDKFDLNDDNRSLIAAICTRLDCLPLALELCAAHIELLTALVTAYLGEIQKAKQLLDDSLQICIELKDKRFLAQIALYWAELALMEGGVEEAAQQLHKSLNYQSVIDKTIDYVQLLFVAARLATAQQHYPRAATLFGLAEQMHSQIHHVIGGPMRALVDTALATVKAVLEPAVFVEAFAIGQQVTLEDAFATILAANVHPQP